MSAEATGWVWRHSPYDGITFTLHLAIADSANDQYGYEFWMSQANLGRKARVSRRSVNKHLGILVKDGYLEVLEQEPGSPVRYRLLFPGDPDTVYESRGGVNAVDRGCQRR